MVEELGDPLLSVRRQSLDVIDEEDPGLMSQNSIEEEATVNQILQLVNESQRRGSLPPPEEDFD